MEGRDSTTELLPQIHGYFMPNNVRLSKACLGASLAKGFGGSLGAGQTETALGQDNHLDFEAILNAVKHLVLDGYEFVMAIVGTGPAKKAV